MTRGIVVVKDASRHEILYLPSDAYIGGSMDFVLEYLDENHGNKVSVKELAFDLMKTLPDLQIYSLDKNPGLDFVYTVQIDNGVCPDDFVYQKVLTGCSLDEPFPNALSERKFYRADMEKKKQEAKVYWDGLRRLEASILPCPHCGRRGWHNITPRGERVCCFIDVCPGNSVGKWHSTFEEAINEWNTYVIRERKL